jgi:hypothetical protein
MRLSKFFTKMVAQLPVQPLRPITRHHTHVKLLASRFGKESVCGVGISFQQVIHLASVHAYDAEKKTMLNVPGAGGLSAGANQTEGVYAMALARNIWANSLM